MNQNQSAALEKKSKDLEERERVLSAREGLLEREKALEKRQKVFDDVALKLEVLKKQIKAKEDILAARNIEVEDLSISSQTKLDELYAKESVAKQTLEVQGKLLTGLKNQEALITNSIKSKKSDLATLQGQIKESRDYLNEQATIVENTINDWNSTLTEFHKEAENLQLEKNKISADIIRLEQDKLSIAKETRKEEEKLEALNDQYDTTAEEYKSNLKELDALVTDKKNKADNYQNVYDMKKKEIEVRERSVRLKEGTTNQRMLELDQKERRLKMNYGVAGMNYEDDV